MISAKSGVRIFSLTYVTYCSGRPLNFYLMPYYAQKKQLPFLEPRAATETCVTNEAKLFHVRTCLGLNDDYILFSEIC